MISYYSYKWIILAFLLISFQVKVQENINKIIFVEKKNSFFQ